MGRDTPAPSPMSHEILNANPYAFLDDAPLEERRARAISLRRMEADPIQADPILDPEVVEGVVSELWPDIRDREELHDLLLNLVLLPSAAVGSWQGFMNELIEAGRAGKVAWTAPTGSRQQAYVAAERLGWLKRVVSDVGVDPAFERRSLDSGTGSSLLPATSLTTSRLPKTSEDVTAFLVREWLECLGPATAAELADRLGLTRPVVQLAMVTLEAGGTILRGRFRARPGLPAPSHPPSWCGHCDFIRVQRNRLPLLRPSGSRHRVVRTQDSGKDPPLDARSVAAGNRAGQHHRIHPLPAALAAPGGRDAAPWTRGSAEGSATTAGSGASGNGLGARHTAQEDCRLSTRGPGSPVSVRHGGLGPVEILFAPLIGPGGIFSRSHSGSDQTRSLGPSGLFHTTGLLLVAGVETPLHGRNSRGCLRRLWRWPTPSANGEPVSWQTFPEAPGGWPRKSRTLCGSW